MANKKTKDGEFSKEPKVEVTESVKTHQHDIFTIVEKNGNCLIAISNKIISKNSFASIEEAKEYIDSKPWELLINASCAIYDILMADKFNQTKK